MPWTQSLHGEHFTFHSVKEVLARSSESRSGDVQARVAAPSTRERAAAKLVLAALSLNTLDICCTTIYSAIGGSFLSHIKGSILWGLCLGIFGRAGIEDSGGLPEHPRMIPVKPSRRYRKR